MKQGLDFYVYVGKPEGAFKRVLSIQRDSPLNEGQQRRALANVQSANARAFVVGIDADSWATADHQLRLKFPGAKLAPMSEHRRRATRSNPDERTGAAAGSQLKAKALLVAHAAEKIGALPASSAAVLIHLFAAAGRDDAADMRSAARAVLADPAIKKKRAMHAALDRALTLLDGVVKRTPNPKRKRTAKAGIRVPARRGKKKAARKRAKENPGAPSKAARRIGSPTSAQLEAGARTYRKWHGFPSEHVDTVQADRSVPKVLVKLGTIPELVYDSDKWSGRKETYVHKTARGNQPVLCTDPEGKRLFIVGGGVRVTRRGLIG